MNKIHTPTEYKLQVYGGDLPIASDVDYHPHMLFPYRTYREGKYKYLVYQVTPRGKTLRQFICDLNKPPERTSFRNSFRKRPPVAITTLDLLLRIIDTCDNLLGSNQLLSQSHINPDMIWVDYDADNHITVRLLDIMDYDLVDENINESTYLSPELLGKRRHILYNSPIQKKMSLNRYDTRPSSLSSVYSIGLILYFIVSNADPYEGSRVHVDERPSLSGISPIYSKLIWIATNANPIGRPTLKEYREAVVNLNQPTAHKYSCFTQMFS